jgi:hypothetical protein
MPELNFIEAYKLLQPSAERGVVDARSEGFTRVKEVTWAHIVDLTRIAFSLPHDPAVYKDWFEAPFQKQDPHFFVAQDAAEAGRLATLVLRHFVAAGKETAALVVLAGSCAGKRLTHDNGELVAKSRDLVTASATKGGMKAPTAKISLRKASDLSKAKTEMTNSFDAARTAPFIESAVQDLRDGTDAVVNALNEAYQALRRDNLRLAEEADMLWWHVGDWSNLLDMPRGSLPKKSVGLVSGVDLGSMVSISPGPYGAYGILKQALGSNSDKPISIMEAVDALQTSQIVKLALPKAPDVFPVSTALRLAASGGDWRVRFKAEAPDTADMKLTHLELATQAYRERVAMTGMG